MRLYAGAGLDPTGMAMVPVGASGLRQQKGGAAKPLGGITFLS